MVEDNMRQMEDFKQKVGEERASFEDELRRIKDENFN
jgi:hypothetical protein